MDPEEIARENSKDRRLQNLKPAQPGEIRNPKGRPKGSMNMKTCIEKFMRIKEIATNPITKRVMKLSQQEIIVLSMIKEARNGSVQAFTALSDRIDGKPEQRQINSFEEGTEINLTVGKPKDLQP